MSHNRKLERTTSSAPENRVNSGSGGVKRSYEELFDYPHCDNVNEKYEKLCQIGKGTFGEVFRGRNKTTGQEVALKRILMDAEKEGFPITAIREIKILKLATKTKILDNIVHLYEVCRSNECVDGKAISYLVFEFCHYDLAGLIQEGWEKISPLPIVKCIMKQLLSGICTLHSKRIIHRDMKSSNILITKNGILKIADFGLARPYKQPNRSNEEKNKYTNRVVTLWYRPPELLLGERDYDFAVDMWGIGCIFAELFTRRPLMRGGTEMTQLDLIKETVGPINSTVWPGVQNLQNFSKISKSLNTVKSRTPRLMKICQDQLAQDLLQKLLCLNPANRITSFDACDHDFIWEQPVPAEKEVLAHSLASLGKRVTGGHYMPPADNRSNNYQRPPGHRPGPSANIDGQYRDHVY